MASSPVSVRIVLCPMKCIVAAYLFRSAKTGASDSREALAPVFADLNAATMHFVGQSTILTLTGDRGTGEAYCLAHHLTVDGEKRQLMIAALRYYDTFVKVDSAWLFAERLLYVDWIEERALS